MGKFRDAAVGNGKTGGQNERDGERLHLTGQPGVCFFYGV